MSIYKKKYKGFAGILFILANLFAVFGGLFFLIKSEYMSATWDTIYKVIAGVLLGGFALFWGIGYFTSGRKDGKQ